MGAVAQRLVVRRQLVTETTIDGRAVHLRPKQAALLGLLLASHPDRWVDRPTIVAALWPDADLEPDWSFNVARTYLAQLRDRGVPIVAEGCKGNRGWRIPREARA